MKFEISKNTKQTLISIGIITAVIVAMLITKDMLSLLGLFFLLIFADD